jgi:hypothetical protein
MIMSEFINTIDVLGDDAVVDSIIQKTITEFNDDTVQTVGYSAFAGCTELTHVNLPELTTSHGTENHSNHVFSGCSSLTNVELPKLHTVYGEMFSGTKIVSLCLPSAANFPGSSFRGMQSLVTIDLPTATSTPGGSSFYGCHALRNVILRNNAVCALIAKDTFMTYVTATYNPNIRVFVPRALLEDYKVATNWVEYADQFYPLEDYTRDGTVTGEFGGMWKVTNNLLYVVSSNEKNVTGYSYYAILTPEVGWELVRVNIKMGGVDVTSQVYNAATGEVNIPNVTGDIVIIAFVDDPNVTGILTGVGFNSGYINGGSGGIASADSDVYTDRFDISDYAGMSIVVNLLDVRTVAGNSRIAYYDVNGKFISATNGTSASTGVTINSTVPNNAVYAAISIAKSSGFSAIDITLAGERIGYTKYIS